MEEKSSAVRAAGALAWHEQVCRGFGEGKPSSADHPFHHMNERKRRKNPVNYADEPDLNGLRHAPKKKRFSGAKHADSASKWAQGPLPAPFLVICMRHPQPSLIVLIASQSNEYANFDCVLPQASWGTACQACQQQGAVQMQAEINLLLQSLPALLAHHREAEAAPHAVDSAEAAAADTAPAPPLEGAPTGGLDKAIISRLTQVCCLTCAI